MARVDYRADRPADRVHVVNLAADPSSRALTRDCRRSARASARDKSAARASAARFHAGFDGRITSRATYARQSR